MEQNTYFPPREGEDRLVERFTPIIWGYISRHVVHGKGYARRYGSFRYEADDIFQECMITVLKKYRESTEGPDTFYISPIYFWHAITLYVRRTAPAHVADKAMPYTTMVTTVLREDLTEEILDTCASIESFEDAAVARNDMMQIIDSLTPEQYSVFLAMLNDGARQKDIVAAGHRKELNGLRRAYKEYRRETA